MRNTNAQYNTKELRKELFPLCALKPEGSGMHVKWRARRIYVMDWETIATKIQTKDKSTVMEPVKKMFQDKVLAFLLNNKGHRLILDRGIILIILI